MNRIKSRQNPNRRGNVLVLTVFMLVFLFTLVAFAIDIGHLLIARSQLQTSADAAAVAAAWELREAGPLTGSATLVDEEYTARAKAQLFAAANKVCQSAPSVDLNYSNSTAGDVLIGHLSNPSDPACAMEFSEPKRYNAVRVRVRRTSGLNGEVPFFFARVFGKNGQAAEAEATAAIVNNFGGFRIPQSGGNLDILPFALDLTTWSGMLAGGGTDVWTYNAETGQVTAGADGVREINLYPQGTGSPGNRGTVDIGGSNNSTSDISRQIVSGVTQADLDHIGGELKFDASGKLYLNGDTGISAGVKDDLASIIGQPRIIPIFETVQGPGNNAQYTIVQFAGVRICEVELTGKMSSKRVIIQPASCLIRGGIPATEEQKSYFVYSPAWLVR